MAAESSEPEVKSVAEKILFVDDEPQVLEGYQRLLRNDFTVGTAAGGHMGLAIMHSSGPYGVIISDMQMPGMNGVEFLAQASKKAPDSARILLTGHADFEAAVEAVNRGNIFRFLTKPCKKQVLVDAIESGLVQYRAAVHQRELAKKAQMIENVRSDWDSAGASRSDGLEEAGISGPSQATAYLQDHFGTDRQCYVLMLKLRMLRVVEERYGEKAAAEYLMQAIQLLATGLNPDDQLFQWGGDVFMAVIRRNASPSSVRMEVARLLSDLPQHLVEHEGRKTMIAVAINFDLLPVAQFSTLDELMTAFKARAAGEV